MTVTQQNQFAIIWLWPMPTDFMHQGETSNWKRVKTTSIILFLIESVFCHFILANTR